MNDKKESKRESRIISGIEEVFSWFILSGFMFYLMAHSFGVETSSDYKGEPILLAIILILFAFRAGVDKADELNCIHSINSNLDSNEEDKAMLVKEIDKLRARVEELERLQCTVTEKAPDESDKQG